MYSKSGPSSVLSGLRYSDQAKNTATIGSVAYSLLGETTPDTFYDSLTPEIMADGFMSRFVCLVYDGERPTRNKEAGQYTANPEMLQWLKQLIDFASIQQQNSPHQQVKYTQNSENLFDQFESLCDTKINEADKDDARRQAWNRAHLNALKIACLLAVADNYIEPVISEEHANWAIELLKSNVHTFEQRLASGDIGDGDDVRQKQILKLCRRFLNGDFEKTIRNGERNAVALGCIPRRILQIKTANLSAFKNHRLGASYALDLALKSLCDNGTLQEMGVDGTSAKFFRILALDD